MSTLVKSIKRIETMDVNYDCPKLIRGNASLVVPGSYIVMIKQDVEITGIVSSSYIDSLLVLTFGTFPSSSDANYHGSIR